MAQIKELREQTAAPIGECKKALEASDGDISKAFDWLRKKGAAKASDLGSRDANEGLVAIVTGGTSEAAMVQLTCETDFSARNDTLQEFVAAVAASAQEHAPPPPGPGVFDVSVEALLQCHLKGRSGGATTVGDGLAETVGKIRENITVAKVSKAAAFQGVVGSYVHGASAAFPGVGKAGAVVVLATDKAPSAADVEDVLQPLARRLAMHVVAAKPKYLDEHDIPKEALDSERALLLEQASGTGKPPEIVEKMIQGRLRKFYGEMTLLHQPHVVEEDAPAVAQVLAKAGKQLGLSISVDGFALYS